MIPVIIGAAAVAAGIGYAVGKNDTSEQVVTKKAEVSEDYVKWQLNRAGKNVQKRAASSASGMRFIPSGDFSEDFEKIENMLASPNVDNEFIGDALEAIEEYAHNQSNYGALDFVAYYREKLRNLRR